MNSLYDSRGGSGRYPRAVNVIGDTSSGKEDVLRALKDLQAQSQFRFGLCGCKLGECVCNTLVPKNNLTPEQRKKACDFLHRWVNGYGAD